MAEPTRADCESLDAQDPLGRARDHFDLPDSLIYLDGNSLGPLTHAARRRVHDALDRQWRPDLIKGWNVHDWIGLPARLGARIARLVGACGEDVVVADSTSINLFKLAAAAVRTGGPRRRIVTERGNFPTDVYVLQGLADLLAPAVELCVVPRGEVLAAVDDATSLVVLTHVHYKTAEMFDMATVTAQVHARGARVLWDLSHSVGAVPLALAACGADLAIGCTYKYLNGGPGAPAFLYVRPELQDRLGPGIAGWLGHAAPFDFDDDYRPAGGIERYRVGTPGVLGMAALDGSLDVFDGVDMAMVRDKSVRLAELFIEGVEKRCPGHGLALVTPREAAQRGSHVSFSHPQSHAIMQALIARGIVGDFRAPDVMRFGFTPLYTRYVDVWDAVEGLQAVLAGEDWRRPEHQVRRTVT